ncbi:hypothetical protein H7X68_03420 [Candidatus Saccharibacteria bacterium]|nr:hypothetical protein [Candidatus Saccharibacteria bacterium]
MAASVKDDTKQAKIKASDHEIYGVTTIVSLLVPTVGIVLGVVYLSKNTKVDRKLGEHLIAVGILSCIVASVIWFTLFTPRIIVPQDTTTITPASTGAETTTPTTPTWDINAEYAKITKGMTKSSVESEISKTATNCSESESSATVDKYASCSYGGVSDGGIIVVNYVNELVTTTEKVTY